MRNVNTMFHKSEELRMADRSGSRGVMFVMRCIQTKNRSICGRPPGSAAVGFQASKSEDLLFQPAEVALACRSAGKAPDQGNARKP